MNYHILGYFILFLRLSMLIPSVSNKYIYFKIFIRKSSYYWWIAVVPKKYIEKCLKTSCLNVSQTKSNVIFNINHTNYAYKHIILTPSHHYLCPLCHTFYTKFNKIMHFKDFFILHHLHYVYISTTSDRSGL